MQQLFIDIFNWICDHSSTIFSGIGASAATLIVTWLLSRSKAKKEAKEKTKALELQKAGQRLQVKPDLWINITGTDPQKQSLCFDLNNEGDTATLLDTVILSQNLVQQSKPFPCRLGKGENMKLYFQYTGNKSINNDSFIIELHFKDKADNEYKSSISGKNILKIGSTTFIRK